ncbi:MAG TPA: hypothetical protein VF746_09005 [Longimicrobium sp.]|jgi:hypothetical protein
MRAPPGPPPPGRWRRPAPLLLAAAAVLLVSAAAGRSRGADGPTAAGLLAGALASLSTEEDSIDAGHRAVMPMTTALPWGAVGFVDNGCTGTLIDSQHVLAASHCFTFDFDGATAAGTPFLQGAWQTGLVFFPNYHPGRPDPPRYPIDRVIVGSRVQGDTAQPSVQSDWGIGHLATPVAGFPSLPLETLGRWQYPRFVVFAGYARDPAAYPQMSASFPEPSPGGFCANFKGNCWWIPAFTDPKCLALEEADDVVSLDDFSCVLQGGNSGSPILWDAGSPDAPAWRITGVTSGGGAFWSASRFEHAPRFAAGVAVASADDGSARTQVFATDGDRERVVSRSRTGPGASDRFTNFRDLGSVPRPGRLAAFKLQDGRPQLVVVSQTGGLFTAWVGADGTWRPWTVLGPPAGVTGFRDVDAAYDAGGLPQLYAVGSDQVLYTRRSSGTSAGAAWGAWEPLEMGVRVEWVSAVRHGDGRQQVFVVSNTGDARTRWQVDAAAASAWTAPAAFGGSPPPLADLDAAWTSDGRVQVFAVAQGGSTWTRAASTTSPAGRWGAWAGWSIPLYAPKAKTPPPLDGVVALTASRWQEENGGVVVPVVFATDGQGNLYVTRQLGGTWSEWRSFYN